MSSTTNTALVPAFFATARVTAAISGSCVLPKRESAGPKAKRDIFSRSTGGASTTVAISAR